MEPKFAELLQQIAEVYKQARIETAKLLGDNRGRLERAIKGTLEIGKKKADDITVDDLETTNVELRELEQMTTDIRTQYVRATGECHVSETTPSCAAFLASEMEAWEDLFNDGRHYQDKVREIRESVIFVLEERNKELA